MIPWKVRKIAECWTVWRWMPATRYYYSMKYFPSQSAAMRYIDEYEKMITHD